MDLEVEFEADPSDDEYKPTNRQRSKMTKKTMFWCSKCDANMVGQWGKCSVCGHVENKQKVRY